VHHNRKFRNKKKTVKDVNRLLTGAIPVDLMPIHGSYLQDNRLQSEKNAFFSGLPMRGSDRERL
jgi:hypothetical protein